MVQSRTFIPPDEREADCYRIHDVLCASDTKSAFENDRWYSASSKADVFDVRGKSGVMRHNMCDREIIDMLEEDSADTDTTPKERVHTRIIFIDEVQDDIDRLQCTSELLQAIFQTYCISSRVARLLERQHMPGRVVQYDNITQKPTHHQFWYSAILRLRESIYGVDKSKSILAWKRLCVWAGHDLRAGTTTILVLRCPKHVKADVVASFSDEGEMVLRQPMLLHAFFAQNCLQEADRFSESWADPIYEWELKVDDRASAADLTARSRAFLTLARQITQVSTDYEILGPALQHLKSEHEWINEWSTNREGRGGSKPGLDSSGLKDIWDIYLSECQLLKVYARLYETRTKIAINECFAMVNQRDSELNIQMARESTQIARSSHQDGQSLRMIQILTMIFLPASLFSGIFGMGFFNTDHDETGNIRFSVSANWWWYVALTIPVTAVTMLTLVGFKAGGKWRTYKEAARVESETDSC